MDWCGIEKALLMPNPFYGYHNYYFKESVKKYPDRLRGVALVDIMKGKAAAEELAQIYDEGILFGMKIEVDSTFQCAPGTRLADPKLAPVWDCCEQYHQPMFILCSAGRYCGSGTAGKDLSPYYICNMPYGSRYLLQGRDAKEKL